MTDERKQCEILNQLFGSDFKVPDPVTEDAKAPRAVYPNAGTVWHSQGA